MKNQQSHEVVRERSKVQGQNCTRQLGTEKMFKPTLVIWIDGHLVSTSPLHCKKKQTRNTSVEGNDQTTCDCQEGPGGVVCHLVINVIILGKMLHVEEKCQAESGNRTTRSNQLQWEPSWLELVRHRAKLPLAASPIFINFAILGKDWREFPLDCDSFSEI